MGNSIESQRLLLGRGWPMPTSVSPFGGPDNFTWVLLGKSLRTWGRCQASPQVCPQAPQELRLPVRHRFGPHQPLCRQLWLLLCHRSPDLNRGAWQTPSPLPPSRVAIGARGTPFLWVML